MTMKKKVLAVVVCVAMMAVGALATYAYLTSNDSAVNTFTVGNVEITLDELDTDNDTNKEDNTVYKDGEKEFVRDKANKYHLIPGQDYVKDPTVHVDSKSENCYLYVTVANGIADIEDDQQSIVSQMGANNWELLMNEGEPVKKDGQNVYYYNAVAKAGDNICVFNSFTVDGEVNNKTLATNKDKNITVIAYAIQKAGFDDAFGAWSAANGQLQ